MIHRKAGEVAVLRIFKNVKHLKSCNLIRVAGVDVCSHAIPIPPSSVRSVVVCYKASYKLLRITPHAYCFACGVLWVFNPSALTVWVEVGNR